MSSMVGSAIGGTLTTGLVAGGDCALERVQLLELLLHEARPGLAAVMRAEELPAVRLHVLDEAVERRLAPVGLAGRAVLGPRRRRVRRGGAGDRTGRRKGDDRTDRDDD